MFRNRLHSVRSLALPLLTVLVATAASAGPPAHAGPPGHRGVGPPGLSNHAGEPGHDDDRFRAEGLTEAIVEEFFNDRRREIIADYYEGVFASGHCPPGLAKKHNGCMPPGQAKKWRLGRRLPDDLDYYDIPRELAARLGIDNPAYKLIRVENDILRVAVATGVVVDALTDVDQLF